MSKKDPNRDVRCIVQFNAKHNGTFTGRTLGICVLGRPDERVLYANTYGAKLTRDHLMGSISVLTGRPIRCNPLDVPGDNAIVFSQIIEESHPGAFGEAVCTASQLTQAILDADDERHARHVQAVLAPVRREAHGLSLADC